MQPQTQSSQQTVSPIVPIDPQPIIEHGDSVTAIVLALATFVSILLGSITGLVQVILILRQTKPSR